MPRPGQALPTACVFALEVVEAGTKVLMCGGGPTCALHQGSLDVIDVGAS